MMSLSHPPTVRPVTIPFSDIQDKNEDLSALIEKGFGPNGLGIISISNVPGFSSLRQTLLRLSPKLAKLPEEEKEKLEDPDSRYNFGWSHGKEKLESGNPGKFLKADCSLLADMLKGSFYANPLLDVPTLDQALIQRYPAYCGRNIWPQSALPELEVAFKAIGRIMLDVGMMVAYHCDRYGRFYINISILIESPSLLLYTSSLMGFSLAELQIYFSDA
uniref:Non-haem dioxygenase N-terminal domain-containing protein n=1 Tax=Chenopodium quinoa TaxID=63459 RepID=A0A803MQ50_CHEQI